VKLTFRERLIAGLLASGWQQESRGRYTVFTKSDSLDKMFVGDHGALRYGRCATKTIALGDPARQDNHPIYAKLLAKGTPVEPNFD
jgi:hypothetical protein